MGANNSKPLPNEKLVIERLRALELNNTDNDDYVHVDEKDAIHGSKKSFRAPWTTLGIDEVEHWEHELLQDPKNRYLYPIPRLHPSLFSSRSYLSIWMSRLDVFSGLMC